jgi:type IX secretion system PorP/SprF family membrane protein
MRGLVAIIIIFNTVLFTLKGQHDLYFSHYYYEKMTINPGAAGSDEMVSLTAIMRQQWGELGPQVSFFNGNLPFELFGKNHGASFTIDNDQLGFYSNLTIKGGYAFRIDLPDGIFGIGISLGATNQELNPEWYVPSKGVNQFVDPASDPAIPKDAKESATAFDLGFGILYKNEDMYVGLSSTHINQGEYRYSKESVSAHLVRHYFLHGGYELSLKNISSVKLTPAFLIGSDARTAQAVLSLNAIYKERIWGGVSYRLGSALIGMIGFELFDGVKVGYAYDFETTQIRHYGGGSHELMLRYGFEIEKEKVPKGYKSIRYL